MAHKGLIGWRFPEVHTTEPLFPWCVSEFFNFSQEEEMSIEGTNTVFGCAESREVWTGPDADDCKTMSAIPDQLARQSRKLEELTESLDILVLRLAGVLSERGNFEGEDKSKPKLPFKSEIALTLYRNTGHIDGANEAVVRILNQLEI